MPPSPSEQRELTSSAPIQSWWRRRLQYRQLGIVRKSVARILREVGAPQPVDTGAGWELPAFCSAVATYRDRPIELVAHDLPNEGPDGIFQPLRSVDVIIYDRNTTVLHQEQIILHELGHLLLGHKGTSVTGALPPALTATLGSAPDGEGGEGDDLEAPLHRDTYNDRQELEAEYAASILSRHIGRRPLPPPRTLQGPEAETIDRLAGILERVQ